MNITISSNIRAVFFLFVLLLTHRAAAQVVANDTTAARPTLITQVDSTRTPIVPLPFVGSIERNPTYLLTDSSMNFVDYKYAGDFLRMVPGMFVRELGSPGQLNGFTINGLDGNNIAFMSDGILLNEPLTGIYNPYLYPTENIERVEIITGTRAFLYGLNSSGMAVNFVSRSRKAIHPYTRLRYSEAPFGQGFFDGMFSQDIIRGLNLTAGVQHVTYDGRFTNSNYDNWGGRMKLRYNLSNKLDLFGSWIYNQTLLGLNGGINTDKTPFESTFDRLQATLVNTDSYEKLTRYDFQLGAAATPFTDTTAITTLTLYHSTNFREYRDEEDRPNSNGIFVHEDDRAQWYGTKLTQHFMIGNNQFDFGFDIQSRGTIASDSVGQYFSTLTNLFGKIDYKLTNEISISPYGAFQNYFERTFFACGGDITITPTEWVSLFSGYSNSYKYPSVHEYFANVSNDFAIIENHQLFEAGLNVASGKEISGTVKYFHRKIESLLSVVVLTEPDPGPPPHPLTSNGFSIEGKIHFGSFLLEGNGQYITTTEDNNELNDIPKWSGMVGLYFWDKLFENHLDLKTGFRGRAFTSYHAIEVNRQSQAFFSGTKPDINASGAFDFVLIAHIGSAYVHLVMENFLDRQYITTTFYPMNERTLRFGVSWDFLD